jgi:hypothetical protein
MFEINDSNHRPATVAYLLVKESLYLHVDYNLININCICIMQGELTMGKQKSRYQSLLENLSDWILQSAEQDLLTMMDLVTQAKAYLRAAEDLSLEEIYTLENYLLRDFKAFSQRLSEDVDNSFWWQNTKYEIWQTIARMSDRSKLEFFEMQIDIAQHGTYSAGELVAIGELICKRCGHSHNITGVQRILLCTKCGGDTFARKTSSV